MAFERESLAVEVAEQLMGPPARNTKPSSAAGRMAPASAREGAPPEKPKGAPGAGGSPSCSSRSGVPETQPAKR